jgi:hypothetical protein
MEKLVKWQDVYILVSVPVLASVKQAVFTDSNRQSVQDGVFDSIYFMVMIATFQ